MKKNSFFAVSLTVALSLSSCVDKDMYSYKPNEQKPASEYFDFNTSQQLQCNINYGTLAAGSLIELYSTDPFEGLQEGETVPVKEADYKIHLDENGAFSEKLTLPSYVKEVFVYCNSYAAPTLIKATVENSTIDINTEEAGKHNIRRKVKAEGELKVFTLDKPNYYSLFSGWDEYGNVKDYDENGLLTNGDLNANFYSALQYTLWGGQTSKPSGLNNRKYAVGSEITNTTLLDKAINPASGEEEEIESINLYFTFVGEAAWYENAVGYYYYDTANPPANPNDLKKIIILPNTSLPNNAPYGAKGNYIIENQYAPTKSNMKVQLLYVDDEGNASVNFPAGITVGYFLISNAFGTSSSHRTTASLSNTTYYSNEAWNGGTKRFIALEANDGSLVYGVEDSNGDFSADDMLFTISASPNFSIKKPTELPKIDEDLNDKITYTTQTTTHTYAFEDIWPNGGDYDLNDVIVEHRRSITFNQKNYISEIKDEFTPVQPKGSANYVDAFAVQYSPNYRENITIPEGAIDETATSSIILFPDAKTVAGQTFTVTRQFGNSLSSGVVKSTLDNEALNPYIISQYVAGQVNRCEIHMPKCASTKFANEELKGTLDDAYYINKDGKHPFAITLPIWNWKPAAESVSVSNAFPSFDNWVNSDGKSATDWYLHPAE